MSKRIHTALFAAAGLMAAQSAAAQEVEVAPEVIVSASRVPIPVEESGSAVTVITEEQLEDRQITTVSDVLRDVPGTAVSRAGGTGAFTQIRLRGAEGNHTLVLIDGLEVNNPATASEFDFANLLAMEIERIEVLRGPQSALYGSDAIGGVINIITKTPDDGAEARSKIEGGSFTRAHGFGAGGYGWDEGYVTGNLGYLHSNNISIAEEDNGNSERDPYSNFTGRIKAGYQPYDFLEFEAFGMLIDSERAEDASAPLVGAVDSGDSSKTLQQFGQFKTTARLMEGDWEHIFKAGYGDTAIDFFNGAGVNTFTSEGTKLKLDYQSNVYVSTPDFADAKHTFVFAAEREADTQYTNSGFFGPNTVKIVNYGYVGEYRAELWRRLFLSASLRYDDNDELFDDEVTYRGSLAYRIDETGTRLHGSAGRAVKNPTLFELFGSTPTFTGNPNLVAEEGFGWDAGIEQALFDGRALVDVTYFDNTIEDLIQGSGPTAVNLSGENRIRGVEVTASAEPIRGLTLDAAYTFTDAEDANGNDLIRRAKHIASFHAAYDFEIEGRPTNATLGVRYNGAQNDEVIESFFPFSTTTTQLGGYTLVNLDFSHEVDPGIELFARGENLLDQDYQDVFGFGTPGIAGFVGVRVKLGPMRDGG